ncbi:MAG: division/cell wall cluster transcriptional repressor MraZ [Chromatiales bacterium]
MFRGFSTLALDAKGRLSIPARYRERLAAMCEDRLILTVNPLDRCLWLYPLPEWEAAETKLLQLPDTDRAALRIKRVMRGYATECEPDGHGRILLPQELREIALLERDVMMLGQGNKFEIWSKSAWDGQRDAWLGKIGEPASEAPAILRELSL